MRPRVSAAVVRAGGKTRRKASVSERRLALAVQRQRSGTQNARRRATSGTRRAAQRSCLRAGVPGARNRRNGRRGVSGSRPELERQPRRPWRRPQPAPSGGRAGALVTARSAARLAGRARGHRERRARRTRPQVANASPAPCRAQRGPHRSDHGGRDSWAGSAADGPRDATARVLQERRFSAAFLPRGPPPVGRYLTARRALARSATRGEWREGPCARSDTRRRTADRVTDRSLRRAGA